MVRKFLVIRKAVSFHVENNIWRVNLELEGGFNNVLSVMWK